MEGEEGEESTIPPLKKGKRKGRKGRRRLLTPGHSRRRRNEAKARNALKLLKDEEAGEESQEGGVTSSSLPRRRPKKVAPIYSQKQRQLQLKCAQEGLDSLSAEERRELRLESIREGRRLGRPLVTPLDLQLKRISSLFMSKNETSRQSAIRRALTRDAIKAQSTPQQLAAKIAKALGLHDAEGGNEGWSEEGEMIEEDAGNEEEEDEKMLPHETVGEWAVRLAQSASDRKCKKQSSRQRSGRMASARAKARIRFTHQSMEKKAKRLINEVEGRQIQNEGPRAREKRLAAQRLRARIRRENETPEEKKQRRAIEAARRRIQREYETPEEKEARRKYQVEFKRARFAKMSEEEKEEYRKNQRNSRRNGKLVEETPEEAKKRKERRALREIERKKRLTPEQLQAEIERKRVQSAEVLKRRRERESAEEAAKRKARAAQMAKDRKTYENGEFDLFSALEGSSDPGRRFEDDAEGHKVIHWWNAYNAVPSKVINELKIWREMTFNMVKEKEERKEEEREEDKRIRIQRNDDTFKQFFSSEGAETLKKHLVFRKEKFGVYFKEKQQRFWDSLTPEEREVERQNRNAYARRLWRIKKLRQLGLEANEEGEEAQSILRTRGPRKRASTDFWFSKNFQELPKDFKPPPSRRRGRKNASSGNLGVERGSGNASVELCTSMRVPGGGGEYQVAGAGGDGSLRDLQPPQGTSSSSFTPNTDLDLSETYEEDSFDPHHEDSGDEWIPPIPFSLVDTSLNNLNSFTTQGNNYFGNNVMQSGLGVGVHFSDQQNGSVFNELSHHEEYGRGTKFGFPTNNIGPNNLIESITQNLYHQQQLANQLNQPYNQHQQQQIFNELQHHQHPTCNNIYQTQANNLPLNYSLQFLPNAQVSLVGGGCVSEAPTWHPSINNTKAKEPVLPTSSSTQRCTLNEGGYEGVNQVGVVAPQPFQHPQFPSSPKKTRKRKMNSSSCSPKKPLKKCRKKGDGNEGAVAGGNDEAGNVPCKGPKVIVPHPLLEEIGKRVNSIRPKCPHCSRVFKSVKMRDRHVRHVHQTLETKKGNIEDTYIHMCKICSRSFSRKTQLAHHYWFCHYEINPSFECPTQNCTAKYRWLSHLKKHIVTHHPKQFDEFCMNKIKKDSVSRMFRCTKCPVVFKGFSELNDHFISSHNNTLNIYACNHCGIVIRMKDHISEHLIRFHSNGDNEEKVVEGEGFNSMGDVKDCELFPCTICESRFLTADYLRRHKASGHPVREESEIKYPCSSCDRLYNTKSAMKIHQSEKCHLENVQCNWCERKLQGLNNFIQHVKEEHAQEQLTIYKIFGFFKAYKCELCRISYSSIIGMRSHFDSRHISFVAASSSERVNSEEVEKTRDDLISCSSLVSKQVSVPDERGKMSTLTSTCSKGLKELPPKEPEEVSIFHTCTICNTSFTSQEFHSIHKRFEKRSRTNCFICSRNFCKAKGLANHNKNVHKLEIEKIPLDCLEEGSPSTGDSSPLLQLITRDLSPSEDTYSGSSQVIKCTICLSSVSPLDFHKQHWAIGKEPDRTLKRCEYCGQSFVTDYTLSRHQNFFHPKEVKSKGSSCGEEGEDSRKALEEEPNPETVVLLTSSGSDASLTVFKCVFCLNNYKTREFLQKHLEKEHPSRDPSTVFPCVICNKNFSRHSTLLRHRRAFHQESKKTYQCPQCPMVLSRAEHLQGHLKRFHEGPNAAEKLERWLKLQKEKPFKCEICSNLFASQDRLDSHLTNVHFAEHFSTFCEFCGKQIRPENMLQHMRHVHPEQAPGKRPNHIYQKRPLSQILEFISSLQIGRKVRDKKPRKEKVLKEKGTKSVERKRGRKCVKNKETLEKEEDSSSSEEDSREGDFLFEGDSSSDEDEEDEWDDSESEDDGEIKKPKVSRPLMKIVIKPTKTKEKKKERKKVEEEKNKVEEEKKKGVKRGRKRGSPPTATTSSQNAKGRRTYSGRKGQNTSNEVDSFLAKSGQPVVLVERLSPKQIQCLLTGDKKKCLATKNSKIGKTMTKMSVDSAKSRKRGRPKSKSKVRLSEVPGERFPIPCEDEEESIRRESTHHEGSFPNLDSNWIEIAPKVEIKEELMEEEGDGMEFDPFAPFPQSIPNNCSRNNLTTNDDGVEMEDAFAIHPVI